MNSNLVLFSFILISIFDFHSFIISHGIYIYIYIHTYLCTHMALKSKCASRYGPPPSKVCPPLAWAMSRMQLLNPGLVTLDHLPLDGRLSWIYTVYATVAWSLFSLCCGPGHNRIHLLHLLLSQSTNYDTYPNIFPRYSWDTDIITDIKQYCSGAKV